MPNPKRQNILQTHYGIKCSCEACQKSMQTEQLDTSVLNKFYKDIEPRKGNGDFKGLIKEFIKPSYNFFTRKALLEYLYYFHLNLDYVDLRRLFEEVSENDENIDQGNF